MRIALLPSSVAKKCADQLEQCLVLGAPSARAKELSDLRQRSPAAGAAVRFVLHHRHTGLRIPDQPPNVTIGAFVQNSRGHAVQQIWRSGVPDEWQGKNQCSGAVLSLRCRTLLTIFVPTRSEPFARLARCLAEG